MLQFFALYGQWEEVLQFVLHVWVMNGSQDICKPFQKSNLAWNYDMLDFTQTKRIVDILVIWNNFD